MRGYAIQLCALAEATEEAMDGIAHACTHSKYCISSAILAGHSSVYSGCIAQNK